MQLIRLNKYLKDMDLCSRRKADEFIAKGYVQVNKQIITELGYKIDPAKDVVTLLEDLHKEQSLYSYIVLNKPRGYVCSKSREDGIPIFDLLPVVNNLTYAGRLDKSSHGIVILSNDGKFVYKVAGAEFAKEKEYIVRVNQPVTSEYLIRQTNGSIMLDNKQLRRAQVWQIGTHVYKIILTEGVNRQIRRMAEICGYKVIDLKRIRIDCISDHNLKSGEWRYLTRNEINYIQTKNNI